MFNCYLPHYYQLSSAVPREDNSEDRLIPVHHVLCQDPTAEGKVHDKKG